MEHGNDSASDVGKESLESAVHDHSATGSTGDDDASHEELVRGKEENAVFLPVASTSQHSSGSAAAARVSSSSPVLSPVNPPAEAIDPAIATASKASAALAPGVDPPVRASSSAGALLPSLPMAAASASEQPLSHGDDADPTPTHVPTTTTEKTSSAPATTTIAPAQVRDEVRNWLHTKLNNADSAKLQILLNDYDVLRDKTSKLKSLLGRSAKAQREAKVELDATQKRLEASLREIERLQGKIDKLATRPTHMELLADFESNFDRALLQIGQPSSHHHQTGGQDTASPPDAIPAGSAQLPSPTGRRDDAIVDGLLMQELADSKQRLDKLETLNSALLHRISQLEAEVMERKRECDDLRQKVSHLELEKRMAALEADHALKAKHEAEASLAEMQLEIDLVTKASVTANARAAQGEQLLKTVKSDKHQVQQLEAKVQALQEWALASSEAKNLAQDRVRVLEGQLRALQHRTGSITSSGSATTADASSSSRERLLFSKSGSLVVGAGDVVVRVLALTDDQALSVKLSERVLLRWKFDLTQEDATIAFSLLQSDCETPSKRKSARHLIQDRWVQGGAAGESENAFIMDNACTLLWSNAKSWIRPKTVKYSVEAIVVPY